MDIKQYIDYFDEISHLKRDVQFQHLEQAVNEIHSIYKFPILAFISFFVRLVGVCLFTGTSYVVFGYSTWLLVASLLTGLLCSKIVVTEINDSIISKALKRHLKSSTV